MKPLKKDQVLIRAEKVLADPSAAGIDLPAEYQALAESYRKLNHKLHKTLIISDSYQQQALDLEHKLDLSSLKLQQLSDVALPICMYCHKIHTNDNYWERLETYFANHVDIMFSHGICPDCVKIAYNKLGEQALPPTKIGADTSTEQPLHNKSANSMDDEPLREMRALLEQVAANGNPLTPEIEKIITRYAKLLRRFNKTVLISDSYQSQLRDFNMRLKLMARTDLLTGLANRWEMVGCLDIEKSRSERHKKAFSLILGDVDYFKDVNDTHGHLAGDRVLREIAMRMCENVRNEDVCARWGGEEFMVLLPETGLDHAVVVAEKLASSIRDHVITWEQKQIRVTMSFGVAEFRVDSGIDELIQRVDDALYSAKNSGRDRMVVV